MDPEAAEWCRRVMMSGKRVFRCSRRMVSISKAPADSGPRMHGSFINKRLATHRTVVSPQLVTMTSDRYDTNLVSRAYIGPIRYLIFLTAYGCRQPETIAPNARRSRPCEAGLLAIFLHHKSPDVWGAEDLPRRSEAPTRTVMFKVLTTDGR